MMDISVEEIIGLVWISDSTIPLQTRACLSDENFLRCILGEHRIAMPLRK
jgi:hypothetical protein